jgi:hypothetical protein
MNSLTKFNFNELNELNLSKNAIKDLNCLEDLKCQR